MYKLLIASSTMALASVTQPALAQDASQTNTASSRAAQPEEARRPASGLNTITVTAQRREESLQDAAIAINAASGDELTQAGVTDVTGLTKIAPALQVTPAGGANVGYFVRGVGNFANNGYTAPAVAFNLDGVYIGRPSSTVASFLDVNRVEVLKGPQGTLYGRNATGGAINVVPNTPELGRVSGNISAQYGNYDAYQLTGVLNLPLGDSVAVRVAGTVNAHDGYFSDGTGDAEDLALRGQIFGELGENADLRLSVDYSTQKGVGPGVGIDGVYGFLPPFAGGSSLPVPNHPFIAAPAAVTADYTGLHAPETLAFIEANATAAPLFSPVVDYSYPYRDDSFFGVNAELNVDLGGVDLVIIPAYRRSELNNQFNGAPFRGAQNDDLAEQYSVEGRLSGEAGPIDWILGAYYFNENVQGVNSFNQFSTVTHNSFDSDTESLAFFARGTYNVTSDLRLVGGLRYTDESRAIDARATSTAGVCLTELPSGLPSCPQVPNIPVGLTLEESLAQIDPALFPAFNPINAAPFTTPIAVPYGPFGPMGPGAILAITPTEIVRDGGDQEITYRLAVEYDASPDNLLYASFETGFRAGGFNITFGQEEYAPEFIDAWTIGTKNSFLDNRLQLNLEGFYWQYKGQQLAALGVDARGDNAFYTRNVGESSILGAELDFQFLATETTLLRGGVQFLDATYDTFTFNQVDLSDETDPPNFLTPVTGCDYAQVINPSDPADRSFDIDCSGKPALYAPDWTISLGVQQRAELRTLDIVASVDARYRSDRVLGFNYLPTGNSGEDIKIDASLSFNFHSGLTITGYVRNLTDEAVAATYQLGAGNVTSSAYEPPRTYGLRIGYEF